MLKSEIIKDIKQFAYREALPGQPFKLVSGAESDYFIDMKQCLMRGIILQKIARLIAITMSKNIDRNENHEYQCDLYAGVALGGCPLATAMAMLRDNYDAVFREMNAIYVRKQAKDHGTRQLIEGPYKKGDRVLLLEDVVTTGGSSLQAVRVLRDAELEVPYIISVVDREMGGRETIEKENIKYFPLVTISEIKNFKEK